ncbi:MAG: hypothetical protein V3S11_01385 [Elusimicrobiota bacterium]
MKRTATLIALLLAAAPALAAESPEGQEFREFKPPEIDLRLPEPEIPLPELDQNRPFPVNAKVYAKIRAHLENYGVDGQTSDGNPALCVKAEGSHTWITACMNFAVAEPAREGIRAMPAVLTWYTGPVEVQITEQVRDEIVSRTYYLSTSGKLETVVESTQPAVPLEIKEGEPAEIKVRGRTLAPSSIEALTSWDKAAQTILKIVPQIEI